MLRIENFTKRYGDKVAVDNLTLHIAPGEVFEVVLECDVLDAAIAEGFETKCGKLVMPSYFFDG